MALVQDGNRPQFETNVNATEMSNQVLPIRHIRKCARERPEIEVIKSLCFCDQSHATDAYATSILQRHVHS